MRNAISVIKKAGLCWLLAGLPASASLAGEDETLRQCRKLQQQMEQYQALRRDGGSGPQMDGWKRQLRRAQAEFRDLGCHYRHRELDAR
ncbi:hypothetical protein [Haliea sp. E17]|uniref:hypothetical protein n=1 Tax=Haliea sp. E17 TaxID=3401576 RepID=UPI003AAF831F